MSDRGYIVGSSSNGLVCFYCIWDRKFTIWNPATGDFRRISGIGELVGFDVRPCGDYRLVVISCFVGDIVIQMHSRRSKRWKIISKGNVPKEALVLESPKVVTLDGCMYWLILGSYDVQGKRFQNVACFDMWKSKYRTISGPPWIRQSGRLGVVSGSSLGFFFSEVDDTLTVWVMDGQDGSWTKRYSVVPFRPQRFKSMRGEEVDIVMLDRELHFYHHATKKFWSFANLSEHLDVVQYKEALFSVYKPKM
jgi:F-box interacting protein